MQEEQPAGVTGNVRRVTHDCVLAPLEVGGCARTTATYIRRRALDPSQHACRARVRGRERLDHAHLG